MKASGKKKKPWIMKQAVISALRNVFRRSPLSSETLKAAKREAAPQKNKDGTESRAKRVEYQCAHCQQWFPKKVGKKTVIFVDHIVPVVDPLVGFDGWDAYIPRMNGVEVFDYDKDTFESKLKHLYQVLCKDCHDVKTKAEGQQRTAKRRETKSESPKPQRKPKAPPRRKDEPADGK